MSLRRLPLHLAVALLTFVVGVVIAASYQSLTKFESDPIVESSATSLIRISRPELEIRALSHACGPKVNAHTYVASDGAQLSLMCLQMASARQAAQEFEKRIANATEVIERREELNEHSAVVKRRVVVANAYGVASYSISGKSFCVTTAPSLKHLKLLEQP
jgi:hypothetical protein